MCETYNVKITSQAENTAVIYAKCDQLHQLSQMDME